MRYAAAKARIFAAQTANDNAVVNLDDDPVAVAVSNDVAGPPARLFGRRARSPEGAWLGADGRRRWLMVRLPDGAGGALPGDLPGLVGRHNQANALAALLAGRLAGATPAQAPAALLAFRPLAHRMELVAEAGGVAYYDDSKGTNVGAVVASLDGFPRPVVLIAGGRDKGGDYAPLAAVLRKRRSRRRCSIGEAADKIETALRGVVPVERAATMDGAVNAAAAPRASPATPSCCRRPVPASTCSGIMRTAPRCSAPPSRASPPRGRAS